VPLRHFVHRLEIGRDAGAMVDLIVVGVEHRERVDQIPLTLALCPNGFALLERGKTLGEVFRRREGERVVEQAQSDAPIGDGASGIRLQGVFEGLPRRPVPERVLIFHRLVEQFLGGRIA